MVSVVKFLVNYTFFIDIIFIDVAGLAGDAILLLIYFLTVVVVVVVVVPFIGFEGVAGFVLEFPIKQSHSHSVSTKSKDSFKPPLMFSKSSAAITSLLRITLMSIFYSFFIAYILAHRHSLLFIVRSIYYDVLLSMCSELSLYMIGYCRRVWHPCHTH